MSSRTEYARTMWSTYAGRLFAVIFFALIFLGLGAVSGTVFKVTRAAAEGPSTSGEKPEQGGKITSLKWEGSESEMAEPFTGVITNNSDWKKLWKTAFRKKAPSVDFKRYAVACVFLGHYPGWWYSIGLDEPYTTGSTMIVPYSLVALIVELTSDGKDPALRKYGRRGQYKMQVVEKKPGISMKLEQEGDPQVPLKSGFRKILEKDRAGVRDEK